MKKPEHNPRQAILFPPSATPSPPPAPKVETYAPVVCPQCGGTARQSTNMDHKDEWYCAEACSYGENFYFTI